MFEWIQKHKIITFCLIIFAFSLPLLIVDILFQWDSHIEWLESTPWEADDILSYISGFMTLLGTSILGIITVKQSKDAQKENESLAEENNKLQRIMAQNLYPVLIILDAKTFKSESALEESSFPFWCNKGLFALTHFQWQNNSSGYLFEVNINYDNNERNFKYKKTIEFSLCNISSSIIKQITIDNIYIYGCSGALPANFKNSSKGNGHYTSLQKDESFKGRITIFFNNENALKGWENPLDGIGMDIYMTNTTITGVEFKERIELEFINITNTYSVKYDSDTYQENN